MKLFGRQQSSSRPVLGLGGSYRLGGDGLLLPERELIAGPLAVGLVARGYLRRKEISHEWTRFPELTLQLQAVEYKQLDPLTPYVGEVPEEVWLFVARGPVS